MALVRKRFRVGSGRRSDNDGGFIVTTTTAATTTTTNNIPTTTAAATSNASIVEFDCYIFAIMRTDGFSEFWFKSDNVVEFLEFKRPRDAVRDNVEKLWKREWGALISTFEIVYVDDKVVTLSSNWSPRALFVSEPGLYALTTRSRRKPEAIVFAEWIHSKVLPSLRRDLWVAYTERSNNCGGGGDGVRWLPRVEIDDRLRGFVYLTTTPAYRGKKMYKIGYTTNLRQRLYGLNAVQTRENGLFEFVAAWPFADCRKIEQFIFKHLARYRSPQPPPPPTTTTTTTTTSRPPPTHEEFYKFTSDSDAMTCIEIVMDILNNQKKQQFTNAIASRKLPRNDAVALTRGLQNVK